MSPCYAYPPPGLVRRTGLLIDSIKLQRERENVKTEIKEEKKREKKEKKREKKEKRRAQKGKEKPTDTGDGKIIKLNYGKYDLPEQSRAGGYFQKSIEDEAEPLEYSGLTEEHEQPIRSPNVSSESTWTGNKRKRDSSPTGSIRVHGTIIRIRLPMKKHKVSEQSCSTSGREDFLAPQKNANVNVPNQEQCWSTASTNAEENLFAEELSCPVPGRIEMNSYKNEIQRTESPYEALIKNWVPPSLQCEGNDFDDEEWLFRPKQEDRHGSKRFKAGNNVSCGESPTLWPHAHYLPEADIYALPYTVLF